MQETDQIIGHGLKPGKMRVSHAAFAVVLIGLGILGLVKGDFAPGWEPVPESIPARHVLAYICDLIYLACGAGLLWGRAAAVAARVLFGWLLLWLLVLRLPWLVVSPQVGTWWPASSTAVMVGTAWVLYAWFAGENRRFGFVTDDKGVRIARALFGLGLIPFGLAHFLYLGATAPLVPEWMLGPVFWSYFTGAAFMAGGLAMITGLFARLAAALITLQFGLLTLLVWVPRVVEGTLNAFQWNEFVVSILLTAAAWVMADSYRDTLWFGGEGRHSGI